MRRAQGEGIAHRDDAAGPVGRGFAEAPRGRVRGRFGSAAQHALQHVRDARRRAHVCERIRARKRAG